MPKMQLTQGYINNVVKLAQSAQNPVRSLISDTKQRGLSVCVERSGNVCIVEKVNVVIVNRTPASIPKIAFAKSTVVKNTAGIYF